MSSLGWSGTPCYIASEISGGQQRLLEFARALVTRPRLVLMDEPFAGVHPEIKGLLIDCIRETVGREGTSFIIVSHEVPDLVGDVRLYGVPGGRNGRDRRARRRRDPRSSE